MWVVMIQSAECASQGIGKLEVEMQLLRTNMAAYASMMNSLKALAASTPSQCAFTECTVLLILIHLSDGRQCGPQLMKLRSMVADHTDWRLNQIL